MAAAAAVLVDTAAPRCGKVAAMAATDTTIIKVLAGAIPEEDQLMEVTEVREAASAGGMTVMTRMMPTTWAAEGTTSMGPMMSVSERATRKEGIWTMSILASTVATDISGRGPRPLQSSQK
jgi:hypothetical protein